MLQLFSISGHARPYYFKIISIGWPNETMSSTSSIKEWFSIMLHVLSSTTKYESHAISITETSRPLSRLLYLSKIVLLGHLELYLKLSSLRLKTKPKYLKTLSRISTYNLSINCSGVVFLDDAMPCYFTFTVFKHSLNTSITTKIGLTEFVLLELS